MASEYSVLVWHVSAYPLVGCLNAHRLFRCGYWCVPSGSMVCATIMCHGAVDRVMLGCTGCGFPGLLCRSWAVGNFVVSGTVHSGGIVCW